MIKIGLNICHCLLLTNLELAKVTQIIRIILNLKKGNISSIIYNVSI